SVAADRPAAVQPDRPGVAADPQDPAGWSALPGDVLEHRDRPPVRPGARLGRDLLREGRRDRAVHGGHRDDWAAGRPTGDPRAGNRVRRALWAAPRDGPEDCLTDGTGPVGIRIPTSQPHYAMLQTGMRVSFR